MDSNLITALAYAIVGLALLIGGIIVPLIYTVIPIAKVNDGGCPMNLVWRLVMKALFLLLIIEEAYIHGYVYLYNGMPPSAYYHGADIVVIVSLGMALLFTWYTHPDGMKSV